MSKTNAIGAASKAPALSRHSKESNRWVLREQAHLGGARGGRPATADGRSEFPRPLPWLVRDNIPGPGSAAAQCPESKARQCKWPQAQPTGSRPATAPEWLR